MYRIYLRKNFCGIVVWIRVWVRIRVRIKITAGGGGLVWNDDVCIRRVRSAHHVDSDILVSAKLELYRYDIRFKGARFEH